MSIIAISIFSITIPLIFIYGINYSEIKDIMLKNNIDFIYSINNIKHLYTIFKALKDNTINNKKDRIFLKIMLISITLCIVLLMFYTMLLYFFPDLLFTD